jgi:hypothetical protein
MLPRAFRWKPDGSGPSTKVTSYDVGRPPADDEQSRKKRKKEREQREREQAAAGNAEPKAAPEKAARADEPKRR